ncbi:uncharacterized protein RJT20DRAFT_128192 [Scheffersomyces xylosifermentans]|uniref:uncharacterized protein n=1 Tax=Scheffersomyces xylosifermentans TaxID=1304137 RepID=UPI00315D85C4
MDLLFIPRFIWCKFAELLHLVTQNQFYIAMSNIKSIESGSNSATRKIPLLGSSILENDTEKIQEEPLSSREFSNHSIWNPNIASKGNDSTGFEFALKLYNRLIQEDLLPDSDSDSGVILKFSMVLSIVFLSLAAASVLFLFVNFAAATSRPTTSRLEHVMTTSSNEKAKISKDTDQITDTEEEEVEADEEEAGEREELNEIELPPIPKSRELDIESIMSNLLERKKEECKIGSPKTNTELPSRRIGIKNQISLVPEVLDPNCFVGTNFGLSESKKKSSWTTSSNENDDEGIAYFLPAELRDSADSIAERSEVELYAEFPIYKNLNNNLERERLKSAYNQVDISNPINLLGSTKAVFLDQSSEIEPNKESSEISPSSRIVISGVSTTGQQFLQFKNSEKANFYAFPETKVDDLMVISRPSTGSQSLVSVPFHTLDHEARIPQSKRSNASKDLNFYDVLHLYEDKHDSDIEGVSPTSPISTTSNDSPSNSSYFLMRSPITSINCALEVSNVNKGLSRLNNHEEPSTKIDFTYRGSQASLDPSADETKDDASKSLLRLLEPFQKDDIEKFQLNPKFIRLLRNSDRQDTHLEYFDSLLPYSDNFQGEEDLEEWIEKSATREECESEVQLIFDQEQTTELKVKIIERVRFLITREFQEVNVKFSEKLIMYMSLIDEYKANFMELLNKGDSVIVHYVVLLIRDYLTYGDSNKINVEDFNKYINALLDASSNDDLNKNGSITNSLFSIIVALDRRMLPNTFFCIFDQLFQEESLQKRKLIPMLQCLQYYLCFNRNLLVEEFSNSDGNTTNTGAYLIIRILHGATSRTMQTCGKSNTKSFSPNYTPQVEVLDSCLAFELLELYLIILEIFVKPKLIFSSTKSELLLNFINNIYEQLISLVDFDPRVLEPPILSELCGQ